MCFQRSGNNQGHSSVIQRDLCQPWCEKVVRGGDEGRCQAGWQGEHRIVPRYPPKAARRCGSSDLLVC